MNFDLDVTLPIPTQFVDTFTPQVKKALFQWRNNVREKFRYNFRNFTNRKGLRVFRETATSSSQGFATGVGVGFSLRVGVEKLVTKSSRGTPVEVDKWAGIAHMAEYGETRSGSKRIFPRRGQLLAIPNENYQDVIDRPTPRAWQGSWIESSKPDLWLFVEDSVSKRRLARAKTPRRLQKSMKHKKIVAPRLPNIRKGGRVLFFGKRSVNVREATPYYRPALGTVFGRGRQELFDLGTPRIHPGSYAMDRLRFQLNRYVGVSS